MVDILEEVENKLLIILGAVLEEKIESLDANFYELGGDSLSLIHFAAAIIKEFGTQLPFEEITSASTLNDIKKSIIARQHQHSKTAKDTKLSKLFKKISPNTQVPMIANRFSYFFRRKNNLHYWNICSEILKFNDPIKKETLKKIVQHLIAHHEGLRLQLKENNGNWEQYIAKEDDTNPLIEINSENIYHYDELQAVFKEKLQDIQNSFAFPGNLFKVVFVQSQLFNSSLIVFIIHHLIVDEYSFQLVIKDFFQLYNQYKKYNKASSSSWIKTMSFSEYSSCSQDFWKKKENEEFEYWSSYPWDKLQALPTDNSILPNSNVEQYTEYCVGIIKDKDSKKFVKSYYEKHGYNLVDVLICAIGLAYHTWTNQEVLQLALVCFGRESFAKGVDLSETIGWISETIPILLSPTLPLSRFLSDTHKQIKLASERGKSYGILKYLSSNDNIKAAMDEHLEPQISLNIQLHSFDESIYMGLAEPYPLDNIGLDNLEDTQRVFLISGGVYFQNQELKISWDYSSKLFMNSTINLFTESCIKNFNSLTYRILNMKISD